MANTVQHDANNHCYRVALEGEYQAVVKYQQQGTVLHITSTVYRMSCKVRDTAK